MLTMLVVYIMHRKGYRASVAVMGGGVHSKRNALNYNAAVLAHIVIQPPAFPQMLNELKPGWLKPLQG